MKETCRYGVYPSGFYKRLTPKLQKLMDSVAVCQEEEIAHEKGGNNKW
jgi:hypothetical protein